MQSGTRKKNPRFDIYVSYPVSFTQASIHRNDKRIVVSGVYTLHDIDQVNRMNGFIQSAEYLKTPIF